MHLKYAYILKKYLHYKDSDIENSIKLSTN